MIDKNFCMSSYLAFRYIEKDDVDFYEGLNHKNIIPIDESAKILVNDSKAIDVAIGKQMKKYSDRKCGVLLSGGMDSAIVASYLPGSDAYTFRFLGGEFQKEELHRAEEYACLYGLNLHYVDIEWSTVENYLKPTMVAKAAPVHSIEPQILQAALQAKSDGVDIMFIGESSDLVFGGMDGLLACDWKFDDFVNRYVFTMPEDVLVEPVSMDYLFERYRRGRDDIDYMSFMEDVFSVESSGSYYNAFGVANLEYYDPYAYLKMSVPLDLSKVRNGNSKYLIRELFSMKYPTLSVPNKNPMPRPVDHYFMTWEGPRRKEFRKDICIDNFTGNQKWQLYCLEQFLNMYEPE